MSLTTDQIDNFWIYRVHIHDGELMPQLRDFARQIEKAARAEALEGAARECDRVANQAAKFSLGSQQDCASELARNIRELKSETPQ
jgi:hypothetical protein